MSKLTFAQWLAAVTAATGKTRAELEARSGGQCMEHAYSEAHLTVEEAVEHYTWTGSEEDVMCRFIDVGMDKAYEEAKYKKIDAAMDKAYKVQAWWKATGVDITWDQAFASAQEAAFGKDITMKGSIAEKLDTEYMDRQQ